MRLREIATELAAITDDITAVWNEDGDRQYCLEEVEDRLTDLIGVLQVEEFTASRAECARPV